MAFLLWYQTLSSLIVPRSQQKTIYNDQLQATIVSLLFLF